MTKSDPCAIMVSFTDVASPTPDVQRQTKSCSTFVERRSRTSQMKSSIGAKVPVRKLRPLLSTRLPALFKNELMKIFLIFKKVSDVPETVASY